MRHISLFTGIGGFELAASRVWGDEYEPVLFCEMDKYCQKVLNKHWPDVLIVEDVRDVKKALSYTKGGYAGRETGEIPSENEQQEKKRQENRHIKSCQPDSISRGIDLLTGGFPCQPFSTAGKRDGKSDDRYLWPEMLRVIKEFRPTWVIGENVAGILSMVEFEMRPKVDSEGNAVGEVGETFDHTGRGVAKEIVESLEAEGYDVQPLIIPAVAVDAGHRRDRVWFVGYRFGRKDNRVGGVSGCQRETLERDRKTTQQKDGKAGTNSIDGSSKNVSDPSGNRRNRSRPAAEVKEGLQSGSEQARKLEGGSKGYGTSSHTPQTIGKRNKRTRRRRQGSTDHCRWSPEPRVGRVANGVPCRVDRLKSLGNAIVPYLAEEILWAIKEMESGDYSPSLPTTQGD